MFFRDMQVGQRLLLEDAVGALVLSILEGEGSERTSAPLYSFPIPESGFEETCEHAEVIVKALNDALSLSGYELALVGVEEFERSPLKPFTEWAVIRECLVLGEDIEDDEDATEEDLDAALSEVRAYVLEFRKSAP